MNELATLGQIQPGQMMGSAPPGAARLSRRAKAAIVVRLLLGSE